MDAPIPRTDSVLPPPQRAPMPADAIDWRRLVQQQTVVKVRGKDISFDDWKASTKGKRP